MRRITVFATIVAMTWFLAMPALAKGPMSATLTGPGIDQPVLLFNQMTGHNSDTRAIDELVTMSGIWVVREPIARLERPPSELGPRFTISWDGTITQHFYLEAAGGAVVHTPVQSTFNSWGDWGRDVVGWHRVDGDLEGTLEALGFSYSAYQPKPDWNLPFGLLAVIGVASISYLIFRNQPRTRHVALEIGEQT